MKTWRVSFKPKRGAGPEMECTLRAENSSQAIAEARMVMGIGDDYRFVKVVQVL